MDETISIACAIHDHDVAARHLLPSLATLDRERVAPILLDNAGNALGTSIARLYNVLRRIDGPRIRAFVHPDVDFDATFVDDVLRAVDALEAVGRRWGALGMVGRAWEGGDYVRGREVAEPTPVCTVDACCLVLDTRHAIDFDELTFDGVHCHVEDYCLQCHAQRLGVFVVPARLEHAGATYSELGSQWGDYPAYRRRLDEKWGARFGVVRTT